MLYYLHRILYKVGFFNRINLTLSASINSKKFRIPVINGTGYNHLLEHEDWLLIVLKYLLPHSEGCFADVGMNIGQSLIKVKAISINAEYAGFEPNPLCHYYCSKLAEANNLTNCSLFPFGLFERTDVLTLYMDKDYATGASVLEKFRKNMSRYKKQINVPVFRGDEIFGKYEKKIGILKADVEGAELEVVKGSIETIKRDLPFLILEILPVYSLEYENGVYRCQRQNELLKLLFNLNYELFLINENDGSLMKLNNIETHGDISKTNYLFIHSSKIHLAKNMMR